MTDIKLQLLCFSLSCYVFFRYFFVGWAIETTRSSVYIRRLLIAAIAETLFDTATAYTVNNSTVSTVGNDLLHWGFFVSIVTFIYCVYKFFVSVFSDEYNSRYTTFRLIIDIIYFLSLGAIAVTMPLVAYVEGVSTVYSYGVPVFICFAMVGLFVLLMGHKLIRCWSLLEGDRLVDIISIYVVIVGVAVIQFVYPEMLITSVAATSVSLFVRNMYGKHTLINLERMYERVAMLCGSLQRKFKEINEVVALCSFNNPIDTCRLEEIEFLGRTKESRSIKMKVSDFLYLESYGNYVVIHLYKNGQIIRRSARQTMKVIEEIIAPYPNIVRAHRSYVVNLDKVTSYGRSNEGNREFFLVLEDANDKIPVSRARVAELRELLSNRK